MQTNDMKKTYISPMLCLDEIDNEQMIAESIQSSGKTTSEDGIIKANAPERRSGRNLWNDEW